MIIREEGIWLLIISLRRNALDTVPSYQVFDRMAKKQGQNRALCAPATICGTMPLLCFYFQEKTPTGRQGVVDENKVELDWRGRMGDID